MANNDRLKYEHYYSLIERNKALIEGMCMHRASGDICRCAELMQECYINIWKHEKQIGTDMPPLQERLWVYWLCRGAFSRLRFLQRTHLYIPLDENMADTILDSADNDMLREKIESLSSVLNPYERRIVELMAEGYTPEEMACELGIKRRSAIQQRYRVISKLRKNFNNENKNKE